MIPGRLPLPVDSLVPREVSIPAKSLLAQVTGGRHHPPSISLDNNAPSTGRWLPNETLAPE